MARKWFSVFIVCILLLTACGQTVPPVSDDADAVTTTVTSSTAGTTTTTVPTTTTIVTTTGTTVAEVEEPAFVGDDPPTITVDGIELRHRGNYSWTSRDPGEELTTIRACGAKYWTNYDESSLTLTTQRNEPQTVTLLCEYPPLSVDVNGRSMAEGEQKNFDIPVTVGTDKDGNTIYTFPLKTDGFYGYAVTFHWERYGTNNSVTYPFFSKCDA